jgi:hypothetical protein
MRAVEVVARALASASAYGRLGDDAEDRAVENYVARRWLEHERAAKRLLRALKDQPPHILDAGIACFSQSGAFNEMLEAMARD